MTDLAAPAFVPENGLVGVLFLSRECAPCRALSEELRDWLPDSAELYVIGGDQPQLEAAVKHETDTARVSDLMRAFGVRETPYLWVVRSGQLVAGGAVNTVAEIQALIAAGS